MYVTIHKKWHLFKNSCPFFPYKIPKLSIELCSSTHSLLCSSIFIPSRKQSNADEIDITHNAFPSRPRDMEKATRLSLVCTLS